MHRIGIHDPGHDLLVGADVGCWNVALRAEYSVQFGGESAGESLQLRRAQSERIAAMPPFAPPNGTPTSPVFHVIDMASARTSSRSALG